MLYIEDNNGSEWQQYVNRRIYTNGSDPCIRRPIFKFQYCTFTFEWILMLLSKTACIKFKLYILSVHDFQLRLIGKFLQWKDIWKIILSCFLLVSRCFQYEIFRKCRKSVFSFIRNRGMWIFFYAVVFPASDAKRLILHRVSKHH